MTNLIVTATNAKIQSNGSTGYGTREFQSRNGSYETPEVSLSARAAALVAVGDTIAFSGWGQSEGCSQPFKGEIRKTDGKIFHLTGRKDNGIDSGHTPRMDLEMVKAMRVGMYQVYSTKIFAKDGVVYCSKNYVFCSLGDLTVDKLISEYGGYIFDPSEVPLKRSQAYSIVWRKLEFSGWKEGLFVVNAPMVKEVDTKTPRISERD
jgi:hypothetical protein